MLLLRHLVSCTLIFVAASAAGGQTYVTYVNALAGGANDGSSWADAFVDLHDALASAAEAGGNGIQIWVAAGEYLPGPADEDPQSSFHLVSGVAMYGGFAGNPRIVPGPGKGAIPIVDLGAYEFQPSTPTIPGDLTGDGTVGVADLLILLANWGECPPPEPGANGKCVGDLDGDGIVGIDDPLILLANWG